MHLLEAMLEHWAVFFLQELLVDENAMVRIYSQEVGVVGRVVDFAHAEAIAHGGDSAFVGVGNYVSRIKELWVSESADGAAMFVGMEHFAAELALVDSTLDCLLHIAA